MAIIDVIKYEGNNDVFVWKYPKEDFNTQTQLIVHESQEAVLFKDGQALDIFKPGRYTLETNNIPLLRNIINLPMGGISPFHCEVYFFNRVEQMAIQWGTDSKIQYMESTYGFPVAIGAGGEMSLKVVDSKKLLLKLVGTEAILCREKIVHYFRSFLMTRIKTYLAQIIRKKNISIFQIDEELLNLSNELKNILKDDFLSYGIGLEQFWVTRIVKPENDEQYLKFKDLYFRQYADVEDAKIRQQVELIDQDTKRRKIIEEAKGNAEKRTIEGYTYQQERGFNVAEKMAQNEGVGNFSSMGIGMGIMSGIGSNVGNALTGCFNNSIDNLSDKKSQKNIQYCDNCGAQILPGAIFCDECGNKIEELKKCKNCGYVFERPGKFCPHCGVPRKIEN